MKLVIERNRLAHLGILLSVSAAVAEILQRFDFKPLAAYGFAVTMVCQINGAILRDNCPWGGYTAGIPRSGICGDREDLRLVLPRTKRGVR